jgi:hypothetical protein
MHAMSMGGKVSAEKYMRMSMLGSPADSCGTITGPSSATKGGVRRNKFDDAAGDLVYWSNARWIEDYTLRGYLSTILTAIEHDNPSRR